VAECGSRASRSASVARRRSRSWTCAWTTASSSCCWSDRRREDTTLRLVAGLEAPDAGRCGWKARHHGGAASTRDVAFVFQQYSLYPHLSVYDNLAFPCVPLPGAFPRIRFACAWARSPPLAPRGQARQPATQLSGGQMQRVASAAHWCGARHLPDGRAAVVLDAKLRAEMRVELKRIQRELGRRSSTSPRPDGGDDDGSRIGVLDRGRLVQLGNPRRSTRPDQHPCRDAAGKPLGQSGAPGALPSLRVPDKRSPSACAPSTCASARAPTAAVGGSGGWSTGRPEPPARDGRGHRVVTLATPCGSAVGDEVAIEMLAPLFFDARGERVRRS